MSLGDHIPLEPLPDARLAKIKRLVFERLEDQGREESAEPAERPRQGRVRVAALVFFAAAAVALVVVGSLRLSWVSPYGNIAGDPTRIVTGANDSHLALRDSSIDVSADSTLVVNGDDERGVLVVLDRGTATCDVTPRHGRPPFVVQAGSVRVRVVGTRFTVTREGDGARVAVAHGAVEVSAFGETAVVHENEMWTSSERGANAATRAGGGFGTLVAAPVEAHEDDKAASRGANAPEPARKSQRGIVAVRAPVESVPVPAEPARGQAPESNPPLSAPEPVAAAAVQPSLPQQLFEQAAEIEARDPSRSLAIYRQLSSGSTPWAENALFAQGRLEADRGSRPEARKLLTAYLARYPRGRNAPDARALLDRIK